MLSLLCFIFPPCPEIPTYVTCILTVHQHVIFRCVTGNFFFLCSVPPENPKPENNNKHDVHTVKIGCLSFLHPCVLT